MKRMLILASIVFIVITVFLGLFLSTGSARTDVYLKDFELDKNSNTMLLHVGVSSSAGYIRDMKAEQGGDNHYITFYSTYGINSKNGAMDTFEIRLNNSEAEIYFYTDKHGYTKVLEKNEATGEWIKVG